MRPFKFLSEIQFKFGMEVVNSVEWSQPSLRAKKFNKIKNMLRKI